ncbi:MAG: WecB/TagA/CpsF family glycosyltransferase [Janthinobacterium lividum]
MSGSLSDPCPPCLTVGSVEVPYLTREQALYRIRRAFDGDKPVRVAFCNANMMLRALTKPDYARTLKSFLLLNDGVGLNLCSRLFTGRPFPDNLNGTDFVPEILHRSRDSLAIFLLGGSPGTAEAAARRLAVTYPRHRVVGTQHGFFSDDDTDAVLADIGRSAPDLLLVGMGNPRQEDFIAAVAERLTVPVVMAVGALLDFTAGNVLRAPKPIRALRAEWLFRLAQEPRRLGRRYTVELALFLFMIMRLRLRARRSALPQG